MNTWTAPVDYYHEFLTNPDKALSYFSNLDWEERTKARRELFYATVNEPYTYGSGEHARTYIPKPMDTMVNEIGVAISNMLGLKSYELCFMNYYENEKQHLGWHADDAEAIDHTRPIAVVSVGAIRQLWTRPIEGGPEDIERFALNHGSLLVMKPGMQHTHYHKIPKGDRPSGPRISLTYRGYNQ
ncbi:alkylated DNA dioxygenase [Xanthomonas phage Xoo-sp13]|nr:alkylated DNA dioxygenase [Xanthomonas phage Xoo-sp13]